MNLKLLLGCLLAAATCSAQQVKLSWDASASAATNVIHYIVHAGTNAGDYFIHLPVGTNLNASVSDIAPLTWYFAATAVKTNGTQSPYSNELIEEVPQPPANMRTVVLQYSGTLTNFYDVGFFKLRLP